jgi:hypothetical protein
MNRLQKTSHVPYVRNREAESRQKLKGSELSEAGNGEKHAKNEKCRNKANFTFRINNMTLEQTQSNPF